MYCKKNNNYFSTINIIWRFTMNVSLASNPLMSVAAPSFNKAEQLNEGSQPDGDHDQDDMQQVTAASQNNPVGASGNLINTFA